MNRISTALAATALAATTGVLAAPTAFAQLPAENGGTSNVVPRDPSLNGYPYYDPAHHGNMMPAGPTAGDEEAGLLVAATGAAAIGGAGAALTAVWLTGRRRRGADPTR
jgi:hypothetical protein